MPPLIKPITGQVDQTAGGLKDETGIKKNTINGSQERLLEIKNTFGKKNEMKFNL